MKILLDGYFDHNLGDDLMLTLAANGLNEHELFVPSERISIQNVRNTCAHIGFDAYLKVTGSGFMVYNNLGIAYRIRDMRRERRYAPINAAVSCNIDAFINKAAERVIKAQLSRCDYLTVRDSASAAYINEKLPNLKCRMYPDIVFSLPDDAIPTPSGENLLGIAVKKGVNESAVSSIADLYIKETGKDALLLCFDTGLEDDTAVAKTIKTSAKYKEKIQIVPYTDISDMLTQMKRCSVILGMRFHSVILAMRMGIPFVPFEYSKKMYHALTDLGYKFSDSHKCEDICKRLILEEPFRLPEETTRLAKKHISEFNEYIKGR